MEEPNMLAIAAILAGLGAVSPLAHAQGYVVNGHTASPAEVQLLASYGVSPGHWVVNGWGISADESGSSAGGNSSVSSSADNRQ
jgi:hypothetical protein